MRKLFESFVPFLALGVAIAIFFALLFLIFQIAIWGFILGVIAWSVSYIRARFFSAQRKEPIQEQPSRGRVINHEDIK